MIDLYNGDCIKIILKLQKRELRSLKGNTDYLTKEVKTN